MRYISKMTRKSLIIAIIIGTIGGLTAIGMFSLSGLMLSKSAYEVPLYTLITLVATIKLFGVVRAICKYFERLISHDATFEMLKDVRVTTVRHLLDNFITIHSKYHLSTLLNRTVNDVEKLQNLLLRVIYPPVIAMITTVIVTCIYAQYSIYAVIVLFIAMLLLTVLLPTLITRFLKKIVNKKIEATNQFEHHLLDYHLAQEALTVFDKTNNYQQQLVQKQRDMQKAIKKEHSVIILYDFLLNLIAMIAIFLVIYLMMFDPTRDTMMYLSIVMVAITLFEMSIPMIHYPYHKVETDQSINHLDTLNERVHYQNIEEKVHTIQLKDVTVDQRLSNINMTVHQGEFVGIAGQSGAGKSTLLKTILGLEQLKGNYLLNGKKIITPANLLQMFNVMEQHNHFINGTVAENMFVDVNPHQLNQLLEQFQLPFNSETVIHSFGENLSGGEKKRLHFIRMILRNKDVWIMDEPFNGVDKANQKIMLDYLNQLQSTTIIMVSHDLSVFNHCNQLYLIEDGQMIEKGPGSLLYNQNSRFYQLLQKQLLLV
ncbi:amino acid ABC transporter ATP-binding/permease protein [Macrococcoides bohemicum]|uniref:amino acid ABC transporter ATP-binding/permease protein n=1 Tax=Macrococcoides bohemicum TaxID=1903056 RepID=UPI000BB55A5C|nr:ATP-binding cassette domain-containing protein [Macrococcus sp. IME1552]ATD31011.1 hypothetical protein BHM04_07340 [Macrococcus sp. IME1552]